MNRVNRQYTNTSINSRQETGINTYSASKGRILFINSIASLAPGPTVSAYTGNDDHRDD